MKILKRVAIFYCIIFATLFYPSICYMESDKQDITVAIEHIYGRDGLNISKNQYDLIKNLAIELTQINKKDSIAAAHQVSWVLHKRIKQVDKEIKDIDAKKELVPEILFYKLFVLKHVRDYLLHYLEHNQSHTLAAYLMNSYTAIKEYLEGLFIPSEKILTANLMPISKALLYYIDFEIEYILFDYKKLLLFLALKKDYSLPEMMNFWSDPRFIERIKKRAKKVGAAQTQALGFLATLALQSLIMAGGSMAMQWEDDTDRALYEQLTKDQEGITTSWQQFQKKLQNDQEIIINKISNDFLSSQKRLQNLYEDTNSSLQQEILYINRSVNLSKPIERALIAPTIFDQYFSHARMLTPGNNPWYNIYQVAGSDWEFDSESASFIQYGLSLFPMPPIWAKSDQSNASLFTDDPAANSIFTEYVSNNKNYTIEVECTIFNVQYPFFAGIFVNRGRWISGAPERIWQYRLFGLYGTESPAKNLKEHTIDLCFAQQKLIMPAKDNPTEKIISPLQQIIDTQETHIYQLQKDDVRAFGTQQQTYRFILELQPDSVMCRFSKKQNDTMVDLFSKNISNLPPYIFMSGGIGFMASGCQASFRVIRPKELVYQKSEIIDFNNKLKSMIQ